MCVHPTGLLCIYLELRCGAVSVWVYLYLISKTGKLPHPGDVGEAWPTKLAGGSRELWALLAPPHGDQEGNSPPRKEKWQ